jgi:hypothetical protein
MKFSMKKTYTPAPHENSGQSCRTTNWGVRLEALGYSLRRNCTDSMGRKWAYRTFPIGAGSIGQFATLGDMGKWARQVERMRWLERAAVGEREHYPEALSRSEPDS